MSSETWDSFHRNLREISKEKQAIAFREELSHTQEWYASRWIRLRELIKANALHIEEEACCIMANGVADANDPPNYAQCLSMKNAEIKRLAAKLDEMEKWGNYESA